MKIHETGVKTLKKMDISELIIKEKKSEEDVLNFFEVTDVEKFDYVEELREVGSTANRHCKIFRDIHVELRVALGNEYESKYPNTRNLVDKLNEFK